MLTLTCRATGGPIIANPLRLSSVAPIVIPDQTGAIVVTIDRERLVVAESAEQIAAMLRPAPEPTVAPDLADVREVASVLRKLSTAILCFPGDRVMARTIGSALCLPNPSDPGDVSDALLQFADRLLLADRLEKR